MSLSVFQPNALVEINATSYVILHKVGDEIWQLKETSTEKIGVFTTSDLQQLCVQGKLVHISSLQHHRPASPIARGGITSTSLDVFVVDQETRSQLLPCPITLYHDRITGSVLFIDFGRWVCRENSGRA